MNDLILQLPPLFIIVSEFNGRHTLWGSETVDPRGSIIEQLLLTGDVVLMNTGEPTHYHVQNNSYSAIDLSLCSQALMHEHTWEVIDDLHGSNHCPILIRRI